MYQFCVQVECKGTRVFPGGGASSETVERYAIQGGKDDPPNNLGITAFVSVDRGKLSLSSKHVIYIPNEWFPWIPRPLAEVC